jgi:hypothetical protein
MPFKSESSTKKRTCLATGATRFTHNGQQLSQVVIVEILNSTPCLSPRSPELSRFLEVPEVNRTVKPLFPLRVYQPGMLTPVSHTYVRALDYMLRP